MTEDRRAYKLPDGTRVPGVTTILGEFKNPGPLIWWACQRGQKHPTLDTREALYGAREAEIGTAVHEMVEVWLVSQTVPTFEALAVKQGIESFSDDEKQRIQSGFDAYRSWERMTRLEITHQEIMLVSTQYRFGGRPDAVGIIDGAPCIIDWKTSKSVYPEMLVQIASYGHLVEHGLQQLDRYKPVGIKPQGFHLCRFSKEHGDFSHHYWPELQVGWEQFMRLREAYDALTVLKARAA